MPVKSKSQMTMRKTASARRRIVGWRCKFPGGHYGPVEDSVAKIDRTVGLFGGRVAVPVYATAIKKAKNHADIQQNRR